MVDRRNKAGRSGTGQDIGYSSVDWGACMPALRVEPREKMMPESGVCGMIAGL